MNKTRSHLHMFLKIKLTHHYFKSSLSILYQPNRQCGFYSFFGPVKFTSAQLTPSPTFPLFGVTYSLADVITPPHRVTFPFHWAKTSSLTLLHLPAILHLVAFTLELKLKHWIRTTITDYPPQTSRLQPSTGIKNHSKLDHSLHYSTVSPSYLLPSQSTMPLELHPPPLFRFTAVSHSSFLYTMTPTVIN
jgi:hypothetical protein